MERLFSTLEVVPSTHNLVRNSSFSTSKTLPWTASFSKPGAGDISVESGLLCLDVIHAGVHPWDAQFRHREMTLVQGHKYSVRFKIGATAPTSITAKLAMSGPPYKAYWQTAIDLERNAKVFQSEFTMTRSDDPTVEFAFHVGGPHAETQVPFKVCVDDVVLDDPQFEPKLDVPPPPIANILTNQLGYLPGLPKIAMVKTKATNPVDWSLTDRSNHVVATGRTVVKGPDEASGDELHSIDFSSVTTPGSGYTLRIEAGNSHSFDIGPNIYRHLKYDALAYFYQTRSGIAIEMPFAGQPQWTHPAGHVSDKSVPCAPDARCDYSLDVSGGWYDAGDYGKYVVNGGISVWTLLNMVEVSRAFDTKVTDFDDGKMNIPEHHNGVPDLLDEARWELEFMMKMQVPEGKPLAGMVHHKIHDVEWTALGTYQDRDPVARFLRPVSTAATLNLAATAAQCARIWRTIDSAFAKHCLQSAETAWNAALLHPTMFIGPDDTVGGGAYEDDNVSDEFYWAAAELFATTSRDPYRDFIAASPHRYSVPQKLRLDENEQTTSLTWRDTAALGTITLAVVPNALPRSDRDAARAAIVSAADSFLSLDRASAYRVPFYTGQGSLPWGSNELPLNNGIVLGLAYDMTGDPKYLEGAQDGLAYILGRNPLDQSYVTGYGFRPLENPHHRFWAHQANSAFPGPPPGVLSGGPNSHLQDPYVRAAGLRGCSPMTCFVDNIEAYSVNEEAINWNAALAWVAAFLDEHRAVRSSMPR